MSEDKNKIPGNRTNMRVTKFSRRQFLKRVGIAAGGAAVASIALAAGCKSTENTPPLTTTGSNTSTPTTSGTPVPSSSTPPVSSSTTPTPSTSIPTTTPSATGTTVPTGFKYVPPTVLPPLINVPGTECKLATDRLYSIDHLWIKSVATDIVILGITSPFEKILGEPFKISEAQTNTKLVNGDAFGTIEGFKVAADLVSPVGGTIVQNNEFLKGWMVQGQIIEPLVNDPYNTGWIVAMQLSKPDELKSLMTALQYRDLVSKK